MANVEHSSLTGSDLHEPKGADTAAANKVYRSNGSGSGSWVYPGELIGILQDQKTSGTAGGTQSSGADRTRDLNTEVYDKYSILSIASNQFTITPPASSTYVIEWETMAHQTGSTQSLLRQTSGTPADVARGHSQRVGNADTQSALIKGIAAVTISAATTYEIRMRSSDSVTSDGQGRACSFGTEVYTTVKIYRVA